MDHRKSKKIKKKFCFIDYVFDCVDHNKLWKILKEMKLPDQLTCLPRNLYASQEATVRTRHGTMDWFLIGKGVYVKAIYCHSAYPTYMQSLSCEMPGWMNPAEIKNSGRNINNVKYADDTEIVNSFCRETRDPQGAGGNKLQVTDFSLFC